MSKREEAKQGHERAVVDRLLDIEKVKGVFERFGDANKREPDCMYGIEGRRVGIEVATAYYEDSDARDEWEIATGEHPLAVGEIRLSSAGVIGDPDRLICDRARPSSKTNVVGNIPGQTKLGCA